MKLTKAAQDEVVREGYDPQFGARPLRRTVQRRVENELARRILGGEFHEGQKVVVDFADGEYRFTGTDSDVDEVREPDAIGAPA